MASDILRFRELLASFEDEALCLEIYVPHEQLARRFAEAINRSERNPARLRALTLGIDAPPGSPAFH